MGRYGVETGFVHLFQWDPQAIAVRPTPSNYMRKYRKGAWKCVMCKQLLKWTIKYDDPHPIGDCPGFVQSAMEGTCLE